MEMELSYKASSLPFVVKASIFTKTDSITAWKSLPLPFILKTWSFNKTVFVTDFKNILLANQKIPK